MSEYKLLALDLDGTLLNDDKQVTEETKKWLRRAADHGVTVMFSTGRGVQNAGAFWEELALDSPMVLLNGAEIWGGRGRLRSRSFLPREMIRSLHAVAVAEEATFWGYSVESLTIGSSWDDSMFERDWMKFVIKQSAPEALLRIRERLRLWDDELEVTSSAPVNIEITVKGVTKESGVWEVCRMLGIEMAQVMAVGDSDNDVRLLKAAGFGVAMGNAKEGVKAISDAITDSNNEDGVAKAIKRYILKM